MAAFDKILNACPSCGEKNNPNFSRCWKCNGELPIAALKQIETSSRGKGSKAIGLSIFAWTITLLGINKFLYGAVRLSHSELTQIVSIGIVVEAVISIICGVGLLKKGRDFYLLGLGKIFAMSISLLVNTVGMFIRLGTPQMLIGLIWFIPILMAVRDYFRVEKGHNLLLMRFGIIDARNSNLKIKNLFSFFNVISIVILFAALFIELYEL